MDPKPTVLITGASTGIGAMYAQRFAERGHSLILVAGSVETLSENAAKLEEETGIEVELLVADLTNEAKLSAVEKRIRDDTSIGILVNNAGVNVSDAFFAHSIDDVTKIVARNTRNCTRLSHAAAANFTQKGEGAIINVSSVLAWVPEWAIAVYTTTRVFVLSLSQTLRTELGPQGIYVQAVAPASTPTDIWEFVEEGKRPPMMEVSDLVDAALAGFDRREAITIPHLHEEGHWHAIESAR